MKHFLLFGLACVWCSPLLAQVNSMDKLMATPSSGIKGKLVELAFQNPELEIADHQIKIAEYRLKEAKGWWLNNISLSFNANDFTINRLMGKTTPTGELYPIYPIYNFGLNIPIGGIFSKPAATKAAREQVAIAEASRASKYRQLKATVLAAYQNYRTGKELLTLQSQATESAYNEFLQSKQKFRNGEISLDEYNAATQQYHNQIAARIKAEQNFNLTKIQLEAIIGVPVENVLTNSSPSTIPVDSIQSQ